MNDINWTQVLVTGLPSTIVAIAGLWKVIQNGQQSRDNHQTTQAKLDALTDAAPKS